MKSKVSHEVYTVKLVYGSEWQRERLTNLLTALFFAFLEIALSGHKQNNVRIEKEYYERGKSRPSLTSIVDLSGESSYMGDHDLITDKYDSEGKDI